MPSPSQPEMPPEALVPLCKAQQMRHWDQHAIESLGIPGRVLMENAAAATADVVERVWRKSASKGNVVVCCGSGNNGGDGYALARLLVNRGLPVLVIALGTPGPGDAAENLAAWGAFGPTHPFPSQEATAALGEAGLVVDALFGTGLTRPLEGTAAELVDAINDASTPFKVAVDIPSGVCSDTGQILGCAVQCSHTVTFQVAKLGLYQPPGMEIAGKVVTAPISIPTPWRQEDAPSYLINAPLVQQILPARPPAGHKGTFDHVLTLCGSAGMGGAGMLAALSALKSGAGLVTAGVPLALRDAFLEAAPELMTLACETGAANHFDGSHAPYFSQEAASRASVVLGCGLGQSEATRDFVNGIIPKLALPLLVDADGLNLLEPTCLEGRPTPAVLTPHPGELARLSGLTTAEINADRPGHARRLAAQWGVVLVLKGAGSIVAAPDGAVFINPTGDHGLATAGNGDVLAGLIGGLLAQGLTPLQAAVAGTYLHGLARDLLRDQIAAPAFTAKNLVDGINGAFLALEMSDLGQP